MQQDWQLGNSDGLMPDIQVCVGCLASEVRMYNMSTSGLLQLYQQLLGVQYNASEFQNVVGKLCWECAALVHKFHSFRCKCMKAHRMLKDISQQHQLSSSIVKEINRKSHGLSSAYGFYKLYNHSYFSIQKNKKRKPSNSKSAKRPIECEDHIQSKIIMPEPLVKVEITIKSEENDDVKSECAFDDIPDADVFVTKLEEPIKKKKHEREKVREVAPETCTNELEESQTLKTSKHTDDRKREKRKKQSNKQRILLNKRKIRYIRKREKLLAQDFGMREDAMTQEEQYKVYRDRKKTNGFAEARFGCELCYRPFNEARAYNNHMLLHDKVSGDLECDVCRFRYKNRNNLCKHISNTHMKKYTCVTCEEVFYNRASAMKHHDWHNGVEYTCELCGATFKKRTTHRNHMRKKHSSGHVCGDCGEEFFSQKGLQQHRIRIHALKRDSGGDSSATATGPYCAVCSVQFSSQQAWTRHVLISPKHTHERHLASLGCEYCGCVLKDLAALREHRSEHQRSRKRDPSYSVTNGVCDVCGAVLQCLTSLNAHRARHTGHRPYKCQHCNKSFFYEVHLKSHQVIHSDARPHICHICGKGFKWKQALQHHGRVHTGEKPYACAVCGKCFSSVSSRTKHEINAHGQDRRRRKKIQETNDV